MENLKVKKAYFDYTSSAPVLPEVREVMDLSLTEYFGNPQSQHIWGREAFDAVQQARGQVAGLIGSSTDEIFFTGSATESNNFVLKGAVKALKRKGKHIISTSIEHLSILHPLKTLEKEGFEVTYLPVDPEGVVDPDAVAKALRRDTLLISVMHANNEIGTIEPIEKISEIAREHGVYFHTDATATAGIIPVNVQSLGVDFLTGSGQTFYGPKGIGFLYIKRGTRIRPLLEGGTQEDGKRGGTENVPGILGIGKAAEIARLEIPFRTDRFTQVRNRIRKNLEARIDFMQPTGSWKDRLPHHASWCLGLVEGATLLSAMGEKGIAGSSGSACSSQAMKPSNVLNAIGISEELSKGSLVLTVGWRTRDEEIDFLLRELPLLVQQLRKMSSSFKAEG